MNLADADISGDDPTVFRRKLDQDFSACMTIERESAVFDGRALVDALDRARHDRGLNWPELADRITSQSEAFRATTNDDDVCSGALVRTVRCGTMPCQYSLMLLRWLDCVPEQFLSGIPSAGSDHRLRWDLAMLHADLQDARRERG